ncbi:TIGR00341 family protein, partial [Natronoarchaeum mannanilyticum]
MRLVQLTIPAGKRETILDALDDEEVDYVVTDETSGREFTGVVYFPLPSNAVEPVLDRLQEEGVSDDAYTVVVDAETVISRKFDRLEERYATDDVEEDRISRQELRTEADEMTPTFWIYVTMTLISAFVATAGLLLDSPAVVVGSMVIAPLIGPALGASVGTVVNDEEMVREGLAYQALGIGLAIAGSAVLAWLLKTANLVPPGLTLTSVGEINERLAPDLLSLIIALGAGVAGVLSLSTGVSTALVGVMIAAALIPPAAA